MIDTSSRDALKIVPMMREYMVEHGIIINPVKDYGSNSLAILGGKSSIGYRKKSVKWNNTGIVFFCTKVDADNLVRDLPLKVESPLNDSDQARPYPVFIPDHLFEQAVEVMKKNPLNVADRYPAVEGSIPIQKINSYQNMFWDEYYPHVKKCLARDGYSNSDSNTQTTVRDTFYLERKDSRDFLSWFESEESFEQAKERIVELLTAAKRKSSNLKNDIKYYTRDLEYFAEFRGLNFSGHEKENAQKSDESSRYQRIRFLGDKKNVYLVKDARTGKYYVQKEYTVYNRNVFDRLKEAAIDGLPEIYEIREEQGRLHTLEEYIDGETLLEKLNRDGVFSEEEIKNIAISICMALKRLHSMKPILLHRDIKPSNIMVDKNGKIYLIDFNASREYRGNVSEDTELIGTQYFASPEQITGYHESTPSSDIFSLGATLSYLMTGVYAKNRIADGKYHDVWAKCIEDSAKDRYQNVEEFIGALVLAP